LSGVGGGPGFILSFSGFGSGVHMVPGGITIWGSVFEFFASSPIFVA
jgi:hypothetical protein